MTDALLVRAPVGVVYRTLTDLDGWPRWLPGCRVSRDHGGHEGRARDGRVGDRHHLVLRMGLWRWRVGIDAHGWRHDEGVRWEVSGPVRVSTEWWLEQCPEGTVVHHVVHGAPGGAPKDAPGARRSTRRVLRHRRAVMQALQGMKDHLELAVAVAAGRVP